MPDQPDTLVALLQQLVRIPSVNPDDAPGTDQTGEAALAEWLAGWLGSLGAQVTLEEARPDRPNLIARFAPADGRPRILLGPHLDTVGISGMTVDPFAATVSHGKLHGRGASDTKGPMAAMLWALRERAHLLAKLPVAVDFVAFVAEESGQWGSKHFARHHAAEYVFAIVGEPTSLDVVHTTKGSLWATLRATGVAAHSSRPECGDNAVLKLARAVDRLERHLTPTLATFTHPVLGHSTVNVGTFHGGTRANIVPDLAEAELDIRITPDLVAAGGGRAALEKAIADLNLPVTIVRCHDNLPMDTPADHPFVRRLLAVRPASRATGAPWFSDAAHLSAAGLPAVCVGPGSIDQAHTADEFIDLTELEAGARFFTAFLDSLARESP